MLVLVPGKIWRLQEQNSAVLPLKGQSRITG